MCSRSSTIYACGHREVYDHCKEAQKLCLTITRLPAKVEHNCHQCPPKSRPAVSQKLVPPGKTTVERIRADFAAPSPRMPAHKYLESPQTVTNLRTDSGEADLFRLFPIQAPYRPPPQAAHVQPRYGDYFTNPPPAPNTPTNAAANTMSCPLVLRQLVPRRSVLCTATALHSRPDEYFVKPRRARPPTTNAAGVYNTVPSVPMRAYPPYTMFQIARKAVLNRGVMAPTPSPVATGADGYIATYGQQVLVEMRRRPAEASQEGRNAKR